MKRQKKPAPDSERAELEQQVESLRRGVRQLQLEHDILTYGGEISPAPENIINRDFRAGAPNEKWLTDITEIQIPAGKVYLSPLIDCFDGLVVSWTIGTRPDAELVNTMLDEGIKT